MAYMDQEKKKSIAPFVKAICKKYGVTGTLSVRNHSTLVLTISRGKIEFGQDHITVNEFYIKEHYEGELCDLFTELRDAMMVGNHDNSDIMTDFYDVGFYITIQVGRWNKPYILIK